MPRITRSMSALACSSMRRLPPVSSRIQMNQIKMKRSQRSVLTKRTQAIGVLREVTLAQNIAINQIGKIAQIISKKQEKISKKQEKISFKKGNTDRARKTKTKLNEYTTAVVPDVKTAKVVRSNNVNRNVTKNWARPMENLLAMGRGWRRRMCSWCSTSRALGSAPTPPRSFRLQLSRSVTVTSQVSIGTSLS